MKKLLIIIIILCSYEGFSQAKDTLFVENGYVWYSSKYGLLEANKDVHRDFFPVYDGNEVTIKNNGKRFPAWKLSELFLNGSGAVTDAQKRAWLESKKISSSGGSALPSGASTSALQTAGNVILATIATNTTPVISTNVVQELRITTATSGTIASGARFISVANIGTANANFNGEVFVAGEESTYPIILNTTYPAISYIGAVGAILKIIIIR